MPFNFSKSDGSSGGTFNRATGGMPGIQWQHIAFLWHYIRSYRRQVIIGVAVSLPLALIGGFIAWVGKNITQRITDGFDLKTVLVWVVIALVAMMVVSFLEVASRVIMTTLMVRITHDIRLKVYESIQKNSLDFHMQYRSGELSNLIANDAQAVASGSIELLAIVWQIPIRILFLLGVMFYFNAVLSILAILTAPLLAKSVHLISRKARKHEKGFLDHQGNMLGMMIESLTNVRQVKHFGLEKRNRDQFNSIGKRLIEARRMATFTKSMVSPIFELILGVMLMLMVGIAYYQISNNLTTTAAIVGCLIASLSLKKPVKLLSKAIVELQRAFAAIQRINWTTHIADQRQDRVVVSSPLQSIELEDVSFSYDGHRSILSDINLTLRGGEHVAVVGASGAGKTTLVDLINGLYPCSSGDIRVNGDSMARLDMASWRDHIGIVSQEPFLFDATIRENVLMGNFKASDEAVCEALHDAGCDQMLLRMPNGIDTRVGERGAMLSGGERKRVALARIFVRKAALIILDEATSELDSASEQHILHAMAGWSPRPVIINISHRPTILPHCDRFLLLQKGKVAEINQAQAIDIADGRNTSGSPLNPKEEPAHRAGDITEADESGQTADLKSKPATKETQPL